MRNSGSIELSVSMAALIEQQLAEYQTSLETELGIAERSFQRWKDAASKPGWRKVNGRYVCFGETLNGMDKQRNKINDLAAKIKAVKSSRNILIGRSAA